LLSAIDPANPPAPVIFGLAGETLTPVERDFFRAANPLGFILFARNCSNPEQVKALVRSLKDCVGREAPVLIDQEGGRVRRLKPPHWSETAPARTFGDAYLKNASEGRRQLDAAMDTMSRELTDLGIQVDCAPVLDVLFPETHEVIGDRAYGDRPDLVATLGGAVCEAFLKNGVVPVIKHIPGHGRAASDSHHDLPRVKASLDDLKKTDFLPFRDILRAPFASALWAMTAHVVYESVDKKNSASCSRKVISGVIRKDIGFKGLLLSDDLGMNALTGSMGERAERVLKAGCDIALHCSGKLDEMKDVAARAQKMTKAAVKRYNRAVSCLKA
jgi:beta-N-acetylhexosaminidase